MEVKILLALLGAVILLGWWAGNFNEYIHRRFDDN